MDCTKSIRIRLETETHKDGQYSAAMAMVDKK